MAITCEHVHKLKLRKSSLLWVAVATYIYIKCAENPVYQLFRIYYFGYACPKLFFVLIMFNWQMRNTKLRKLISSLWTC